MILNIGSDYGQETGRTEENLTIMALDVFSGFICINIVSNFIPIAEPMPEYDFCYFSSP